MYFFSIIYNLCVYNTHLYKLSGSEWNEPEATNCSRETEPMSGSTYPGGLPEAAYVVMDVLKKITKHVHLLNITTLSQLRKDAHPASYNGFKGMDCTHWCVAGLPDTWNHMLYAAITTSNSTQIISHTTHIYT